MSDTTEIDVEYAYLTIPKEYLCVYHKLVTAIAEFGKDILDDCKASCSNKGKCLTNCWNLFQSAIANYNLEKYKEANFFIDYINKQLVNLYKNETTTSYLQTIPVKITEDGKLKAIMSCEGNNVHFFVDIKTGKLYEKYITENVSGGQYRIINEDLVFSKEGFDDDDSLTGELK